MSTTHTEVIELGQGVVVEPRVHKLDHSPRSWSPAVYVWGDGCPVRVIKARHLKGSRLAALAQSGAMARKVADDILVQRCVEAGAR